MREREAEPPRGEHGEVWELLPWHANGTLAEAERVRVERHVADCAACRQELTLCRDTGEAVRWTRDGAWEPPPEQLDRLLQRLPAQPDPRVPLPARLRSWWDGLPDRVGWVLAGQSALAAGLAAVVLWQAVAPRPAVYETLTSAGPEAPTSAPRLEIAFAEDATEIELRELLLSAGASIVRGPSTLGVYTVSLAPDARVGVDVESLRADPRVRFVEPISDP